LLFFIAISYIYIYCLALYSEKPNYSTLISNMSDFRSRISDIITKMRSNVRTDPDNRSFQALCSGSKGGGCIFNENSHLTMLALLVSISYHFYYIKKIGTWGYYYFFFTWSNYNVMLNIINWNLYYSFENLWVWMPW
jgi:hypothetical protein